jgi:hypothetical protein
LRLVVLAALLLAPAAARGDGHLVYAELFGKGGLAGVGYEHRLSSRHAAGALASAYLLDGDRVAVLSPYLGVDVLARGRHAWFVHAGPQLVRVHTPSPVPEWDGRTAWGVAGALASGYEWRGPVNLRAGALVVAGKGGVAPWLGLSLGWSF